MATFSTNQVRQLYVVKSAESSATHVLPSDTAGKTSLQFNNNKNHLYFEYKGADNLMRSDLIDINNILYAKSTKAVDMDYKMKSFTVKLDTNINGGNPIAGQDYLLRIAFSQYVGMSDEDQYFKYGMVHAHAGMKADNFYKILAQSLAINFSRENTPLIKIEVHSAATVSKGNFDSKGYMSVTPFIKDNGKADNSNPYFNGTDAAVTDIDSIRITEVEQPWRLGVMSQVPVYFTVQPSTITYNGDEVVWGTATKDTNGTIGNGKNIADLEYFCMGERGDIYRGIEFPNNIVTSYLVDPSKKYSVLDIHYAYVGSNESVQKSEKTITLVCDDTAKVNLNNLITRFNTATGDKFNVAQV